eukprot:357713-Chlamydomonas_euryale.AAC.21
MEVAHTVACVANRPQRSRRHERMHEVNAALARLLCVPSPDCCAWPCPTATCALARLLRVPSPNCCVCPVELKFGLPCPRFKYLKTHTCKPPEHIQPSSRPRWH